MELFKYPSTPHLAIMGNSTIRGDKVLSPREAADFLSNDLIIEEKIDGANLGISFDSHGNVRAQNRGGFLSLPATGQWHPLHDWLILRKDRLLKGLSDRYILFGEWCYATHSVFYNQLPDWFLGFDLYDTKTRQFAVYSQRNELLAEVDIKPVPLLDVGRFDLPAIMRLIDRSKVGTEIAEGLVLRKADGGNDSVSRAKLVRAEFIQTIDEHWAKKPLRMNRLSATVADQPEPSERV